MVKTKTHRSECKSNNKGLVHASDRYKMLERKGKRN